MHPAQLLLPLTGQPATHINFSETLAMKISTARLMKFLVLLFITNIVLAAPQKASIPDRSNLEIVGHSDLLGAGKGGEGLALKEQDGKRYLYLAHESGPQCFSIVDVTNPSKPTVLKQEAVEAAFVRCNSLALNGNILIVARQTELVGQPFGGIKIYDVSNPTTPVLLNYMDLTGAHSRGTHYLTFYEGRYAYLSTGSKDFEPKNPKDDQFLMIVDLKDPKNPVETGRWWYPGTRIGDPAPSPARVKPFDSGFRLHTALIPPSKPDRVYAGWIDGGVVELDISDKAHPKLVTQLSWQSANQGFTHTVLPILERGLLVASQESTKDNCEDWPMRIMILDVSNELNPYTLSYLPQPINKESLCKIGGRFGAHNINQNNMPDVSRVLQNTVVTAQFAGGLRIFSIKDPSTPKEIAYFHQKVANNKGQSIQINDLIIGKDGLIYTNDRFTGGLYILKYTGKIPLD